jgi:DNA-binding MarR family transcriptional regulator
MAAWGALIRAHTRLFAQLDAELVADHGLSLADYEVLVQLSAAPGGVRRMAELAQASLVSPSGLTRRVDGLQAKGLVCRRSCPSDGRGSLAALTDEGRRRLAEAAPTHARGVRSHLIDKLSPAELAVMAAALERVAGDLA